MVIKELLKQVNKNIIRTNLDHNNKNFDYFSDELGFHQTKMYLYLLKSILEFKIMHIE